MSLSNPCPQCGREVPIGDPLGCFKCLVAWGLGQVAAPLEFGDYQLLEEIGRGAMGVVYRARQNNLDRLVALKMMVCGNFAPHDFTERLRIEAAAGGRLRHNNIVAVHDIVEHHSQPFIVMDLVEGSDLAELTRERPLPPGQAARYMEKIARAIHFAHEKEILHRDLKPSNILIDLYDEPKVTDFGLAKILDKDLRLSRSGDRIGTPAYMSPEQVSSEFGPVGRGCDIYSLGAVLYHLLTGRPPFNAGDRDEQYRQICNEVPAAPRVINSSIPAELQTISLKCLERESSARYLTAQDLAEDLRRWSNNEPILARPAALHQKAIKWMRRNPSLVFVILLLAFVALLGLALLFEKSQSRFKTARTELAQAETLTTKNLLRFVTAENSGQKGDVTSQLAGLNALVHQGNTNSLSGRVSRVANVALNRLIHLINSQGRLVPAAEPFLHIGEISVLEMGAGRGLVGYAQADGQLGIWDVKRLRTVLLTNLGKDGVSSIAFDSHSSEVLVCPQTGAGQDNWKKIASTNGITLMSAPPSSRILRRSPDGRTLLTGHVSGVCTLWDAGSKEKLQTLAGLTNEIVGAEYDVERGEIVALSKDGWFCRWNLSGVPLAMYRFAVESNFQARIFPGLQLTCAAMGTKLKLFDYSKPQTQSEVAAFDLRDSVTAINWSPDGRFIAATCGLRAANTTESRVWLIDVARRSVRSDPLLQHGLIRQVRFSPNGAVLATASQDGSIMVWDPENGERLANPAIHPEAVTTLCFADDSQTLAAGSNDKSVVLWRLEPSLNAPVRGVSPSSICDLDVAKAGNLYATASWDGELKIWKWGTGSACEREFKHPNGALLCRLTPSGRHLLTFAADKKLRLWSVPDGALLQETGVPTSFAYAAEISRDGSTFALSLVGTNWESSVSLWHVDGKLTKMVELPHPWLVSQMSFSPDSKIVATASWDGVVRLWRAQDGLKLAELIGGDTRTSPLSIGMIRDIWSRVFPDGVFRQDSVEPRAWPTHIGSNTLRGVPVNTILDLRGVRASSSTAALGDLPFPFKAFGFPEEEVAGVLKASYGSISFSPDGESLAASTSMGVIHVWRVPAIAEPERQPWRTFQHQVRAGVNSVEYSPNGRYLVSAGGDFTARIWDLESAQEVCAPLLHGSAVNFACFHPSGEEVLTFDAHQVVRTWDAGTGLPLSGPFRDSSAVLVDLPLRTRAFYSSDGRYVLAASSGAQAWEWEVWRPTYPTPGWFSPFVSALTGRDTSGPTESTVPPMTLFDQMRQRKLGGSTNTYARWASELSAGINGRGRYSVLDDRRNAQLSQLIALDSLASLNAALRLDPTNGALLSRLGQKISDTDTSSIGAYRASHLRKLALGFGFKSNAGSDHRDVTPAEKP